MRVQMQKEFNVAAVGEPNPKTRAVGEELNVDSDTGEGLIRDKIAREVKAKEQAPENKTAREVKAEEQAPENKDAAKLRGKK